MVKNDTMNETLKNIYERRAVRKYKQMSVSKDVIDMLLDPGRMAPSAMNRQPWKFYVLTDVRKIKAFSKEIAENAIKEIKHAGIKETIKMTLSFFHLSKMIDFLKQDDHIFYGAPVVIFLTSPKEEDWGALDVGMCAQNIMLAAKSLGLDTCPVGFAKFVTQAKDYYLLNIPATEKIHLAITVGYGDEHPAIHERIEDNASYIE